MWRPVACGHKSISPAYASIDNSRDFPRGVERRPGEFDRSKRCGLRMRFKEQVGRPITDERNSTAIRLSDGALASVTEQ
jgi:hypothetical protein